MYFQQSLILFSPAAHKQNPYELINLAHKPFAQPGENQHITAWRCYAGLVTQIAGPPLSCVRERDRFKEIEGRDMNNIAYVLESDTTLFRAVELQIGISFSPIYDLVGSSLIEMIRFDDMHSLFLDEEALRDGLTAFTVFDGCLKPLAGKIVLVGGDGREPYHSPLITIADAAARFQCCRPVLDPVFVEPDDVMSKGLIFPGALAGLQFRIDRRPPILVEGPHDENRGSGK